MALLTGPDDGTVYTHKTVGEGLFETGILATSLTLEQPVPLVSLLESLVDAVVREGGVTELRYLLIDTVTHPLHGHVHRILRRLIELIENDEVNGDGLEPHPGGHTPEIKKTVPHPLDVGRIGIPDPSAYCFRVLINQGIDPPFGEVRYICLIGEEIQDAPVVVVPFTVDRSEHRF
jgi:hypothetical protein